MKKRAPIFHGLTILFFSVLSGTLVFWLMGSTASDADENSEIQAHSRLSTVITPHIPADLTFAGIRVPLDRPIIKQQLEAELIYNMHTLPATILILKRSPQWQDTMLTILKSQGIPEDFYYLMVAESAVRNVRSPAGAQGFWQFMPQTAKEYGMRVDAYVDERNDPIRATRAAAKYLKRAHGKFGDWAIAAASYNMGMGGINQSMNHQNQASYFDLHLNSETSRYLFRILAFKCIMENPSQYGFYLTPSDSYQMHSTREVSVNSAINWVSFAKTHGTTLKELRWLNPWIDSSSLNTTNGESYQVLIPEKENSTNLE